MEISRILGRNKSLFQNDLSALDEIIKAKVSERTFLLIGGAGSIGRSVCKEIFKRSPRLLHVVDLNENNLTELVRDLRSSFGYIKGEFATFCLDTNSVEFRAFLESRGGPYDYVVNLSALKHVRSESDQYTLMRMLQVNIFNTKMTLDYLLESGSKYFCVSTDKAANPVNLMGASKKIMEMYLSDYAAKVPISTARFANVAFSDGSLLDGFTQRVKKHQPIVIPADVRRYFFSPEEAGELCMLSTLLGLSGDIFVPKQSTDLNLVDFFEILERFLFAHGYKPMFFESESDARCFAKQSDFGGLWPVYISPTDTTGEKPFEEFYEENEVVDEKRFKDIAIVKLALPESRAKLDFFEREISELRGCGNWTKHDLVIAIKNLLPDFAYVDKNKFLDDKM